MYTLKQRDAYISLFATSPILILITALFAPDPIFYLKCIPAVFVVVVGSILAISLVVQVLANALGGIIQKPRKFDNQLLYEIAHTLSSLFVVAIISAHPVSKYLLGLPTGVTWNIEEAHANNSYLIYFAKIWVGVLAADAFTYWKHKIFHSKPLFAIHRIHHTFKDPSCFTSFALHPLESFATFFPIYGFSIAGLGFYLPLHVPALFIFSLLNLYLHCGREVPMLEKFLPSIWMNTSVFHNEHHEKTTTHFGEMLFLWDYLMGTSSKLSHSSIWRPILDQRKSEKHEVARIPEKSISQLSHFPDWKANFKIHILFFFFGDLSMAQVFPVLAVLFVISAMLTSMSFHQIEEGYVGVYYRGGALQKRMTEPGWHFKIPFLEHVDQVQVTMQTDKVTDIPCGTSGGTLLKIERVEVVNRLRKEAVYETIKNYTVHYDKIMIFDRIHHELNQFCSKHTLQEVYIDLFHTVDDRLQAALQEACDKFAPGIEIIAIRITKPQIPATILQNYEQMESEKTKLLIAVESQKVREKEAETEKKKATIAAEKDAAVSKIAMDKELNEKMTQQKIKEIDDAVLLHHAIALADADAYTQQKKAEANSLLFSPQFLQLELIRAIGNNTKTYFGSSLFGMVSEFFDMYKNAQEKIAIPAKKESNNKI